MSYTRKYCDLGKAHTGNLDVWRAYIWSPRLFKERFRTGVWPYQKPDAYPLEGRHVVYLSTTAFLPLC